MSNCKTLLDLPLEVLDLIFKQLSQSHKLRLAYSHPILADAFVYHVGDLFKRVDLDVVPPQDCLLILRLCGPSILEIDTWCYFYTNIPIFELIQRYCTNLQFFKSRVDRNNVTAIASLVQKSESLKSIHLSFLDHKLADIPDIEYIMNVLVQLRPLRKLKLEVVPDTKFHLIKQYVNLEELDISGSCYRFVNTNIFEMCAPLIKLRSLRVSSCNVTKPFRDDGVSFPLLENLRVDNCNISQEFPFFPRLKSVKIENWNDWRYQNLEAWLRKLGNTLQEVVLQVNFFCEPIMLSLLRSCRKLRYLYVQPKVFCTISKTGMSLFVDILKERGFTPDNPFKLTIIGYKRFWDDDQDLLESAKVFEEEPTSELLRCTSYLTDAHLFK
ncbi:uncharacterized protein LOC119554569 [Drosophila subpulchrella]|uniref:uncharacterized protein LOC119554569 n=1 Tax=Drosophila subpulchrella TaxID=1486046 RepID=UPI0018A129F5|nr:uncharacterized protein LOC119554569 [Drosophila subpulchrella]